MTPTLPNEAAIDSVARLLAAGAGLAFGPARRGDLEAGTRRAMARSAVTDVEEYLHLVQTGRLTIDDLIDELTVGESYFFREPAHFDFIRREVLPGIRRLRGPDHRVRAWSAGCASGEEAYSLGILFDEEGVGEGGSILATDISRAALARAARAVYGAWSLRGVAEPVIQRYFRRAHGRLALQDRLRRRVALEPLNLARPPFPPHAGQMDLILCRNVLIYLEPDVVAVIGRHLFDSLAEGGWLITGPSDPSVAGDAPYEAVISAAGVFYRRPAAVHRPWAPPNDAWANGRVEPPPPAPTPRLPAPESPVVAARSPATPLAAAEAAFRDGEYRRAAELTRPLGADPAAAALRVRALANAGGSREAERACAEAVTRHPLSPGLHYLHAVLLLDLGRDEEAARSARRAVYLDRSLAAAHLTLGTILERSGDVEGARRAYRNARDLCAARPGDEVVPLADGERAGRLAEVAGGRLARLEARGGLAS